MTIQNLNFGTGGNNDGEVLRTAFPKIQANFEYLSTQIDLLLAGGGEVTDGDKGDIIVSSTGTVWTADPETVLKIAGDQTITGVKTFDADITQVCGGGLWPDTEIVNMTRLDRVFVGDAAASGTGNRSGVQGSIASTSAEGANWAIRDTSLLCVAPTGLMAITGMSRSSDQTEIPAECIGVAGFVINDKSGGYAWGLYSDIQHEAGAASSYGLEVAAKNKGSNVDPDPYGLGSGACYGLWLAGGGDDAYGGSPTNPSAAAMVILANDSTWNKGIVFEDGSLTGSFPHAIAMPRTYRLSWYRAAGSVGGHIRSDVTTAGQSVSILMNDNVVQFLGANSNRFFQAAHVANAVNFVSTTAAIATASPTIAAAGNDTNINLTLQGKGTGGVIADAFTNTGLHILDTDASHDLIIAPGSNLSSDRTLTITTGDADRTLTISGNATISQDYSTTGNPQFATIELGAASDTTISRVSAGRIAVEGSNVLMASDIGVTVQGYDADLAAIAGLTSAADKGIYFTGSGAAATYDLSSVARTLLAQTSQANMRSTGLGLGSLATLSTINGGNWSGTDLAVADGGTNASTARGACANLVTWYVIGSSNVAVSHTGNTSKTALATVNIPAGVMGANGRLRITSMWSITGSTNNKFLSYELGGTIFMTTTIATGTTIGYRETREIGNRNNASSQITHNRAVPAFGLQTLAPTTGAVNTANAQDLIFYAQLANSGETITLESYTVELFYSA